jgi:hypothetical protein
MRFSKYAAVLSVPLFLFSALPADAEQELELQELMDKDIEGLVVSVASKREASYHEGPFEGSFGLFRSVQKNSISIDSATARYANGSTIQSFGVEMEGKYRFSFEWKALASLMVQQNEQDGRADANLTPNNSLKTGVVYMPKHYASLGLFNQFIGAGVQEKFFWLVPARVRLIS